MTFRTLAPWKPLDELMSLPLAERIKYVRLNLASRVETRRQPNMSHDDFGQAVGAKDRQAPIRWEKGATPRAYAERIAALTPYPPAAFGAVGEAELVRETFASRLAKLEEEAARVVDVARLDRTLRAAIRSLASGDAEGALRALLAEDAP